MTEWWEVRGLVKPGLWLAIAYKDAVTSEAKMSDEFASLNDALVFGAKLTVRYRLVYCMVVRER